MVPSEPVFPPSGRILAIDPGTRRIGVAVSDPGRMLAQPLCTVDCRGPRKDVEAMAQLAREQEAVGIVVGLARNMDGSAGPAFEAAAKLVERLREATGLPVAGWDERLTSAQAERTLIASGMRRDKRRKGGFVDRVAAALILESFLAHLERGGEG